MSDIRSSWLRSRPPTRPSPRRSRRTRRCASSSSRPRGSLWAAGTRAPKPLASPLPSGCPLLTARDASGILEDSRIPDHPTAPNIEYPSSTRLYRFSKPALLKTPSCSRPLARPSRSSPATPSPAATRTASHKTGGLFEQKRRGGKRTHATDPSTEGRERKSRCEGAKSRAARTASTSRRRPSPCCRPPAPAWPSPARRRAGAL